LSREYAVDPLEILFVREVMRTNVAVLPSDILVNDVAQSSRSDHRHSQRLYPVVDDGGRLTGVLTRGDLHRFLQEHPNDGGGHRITELVRPTPATAYADEPLRVVVYRMAETGLTRLLVVQRNDPRNLVGIVALDDLLKARVRSLDEERRRERVLTVHRFFPLRSRGRADR
jgi:chloride channel protein, CIC family